MSCDNNQGDETPLQNCRVAFGKTLLVREEVLSEVKTRVIICNALFAVALDALYT